MKRFIAVSSLLLVQFAHAQSTEIKSFPALGVNGGRYVLGQISSMRRDQYLLDTQTGRIWESVNIGSGNDERMAFRAVPFIADDAGIRYAPVPTPSNSQR